MITGNYLRQLREQMGLSQQQVACSIGVSQSTYCTWECSKALNLRVEHTRRLSIFFGVSLLESEPASEADLTTDAALPSSASSDLLIRLLYQKIVSLQERLRTLDGKGDGKRMDPF